MTKPIAWLGQGLLYAGFAVIIGYCSSSPPYSPLAEDKALIKLSFNHHGTLVSECRQRSAEELAKLAPNMRAPLDCKRERSPVTVEMDIDGTQVYRHVAMPSGVSKDGASSTYKRFEVAAGTHRVAVRFNDDARQAGFTHQREVSIDLHAGRVLIVDFSAEKGGITFQ